MKITIKLYSAFITGVFLSLFSCQDDTDRIIQTDLPTEAQQIFDTSKNLGESLFVSLYSYTELSSLPENLIPGCPRKSIKDSERTIILDYDQTSECGQEQPHTRKGKIKVSYFPYEGGSGWIIEFENYSFDNFTIRGQREFLQTSPEQITESFENLIIESPKNLSTKLSGTFAHNIQKLNEQLSEISSNGSITGVNPAGRNFEMATTTPRLLLFSCLQSNNILPVSGTEIWQVSRTGTTKVSYSISYEKREECVVDTYAILPDGRKLLLNQ